MVRLAEGQHGLLPQSTAWLGAQRGFAAAQYNPEGQMSAVTFLGPRDMRVTKKPIPKLSSPTVRRVAELACTQESGVQGLHMKTIISEQHQIQINIDSSCHALQDVVVRTSMAR